MVPGETVTKEVIKEVEVPGQTVVVEKEVVKTVEVPGQTVVVEKVVVKEVPGKKYVTDPTTGKVVSAPEYGGTFTWVSKTDGVKNIDNWPGRRGAVGAGGVVEQLAIADWGIDRAVFNHMRTPVPVWVMRGQLAESWSTPDDTTIIFNIRKGVHWHDKAPMNGRELVADDIVYNWHRYLGLGKWSEFGPIGNYKELPVESVTATDDWTVVFKLKEPFLGALNVIFNRYPALIYPPEVIEEHGHAKNWEWLVGTGPYEVTDYVEGTSATWTKVPDYWGFDEKFPENRLPYTDEIRMLLMLDEATRISAMRTAKIDYMGWSGGSPVTLDQMEGLKKTNPEMTFIPYVTRSDDTSFAMNVTRPPFNDIRVRKAMQMAQDLEIVNTIYFKGSAKWKPQGVIGDGAIEYFVPFDEWPEEVKKGYRYDPEGAEKLLDEAGYPRGADGNRFKVIQEQIVGSSADVSISEMAAGYWAKIGVDVEVTVPGDKSAQRERLKKHNFDMASTIMGYDRDPPWLIRKWRAEGTFWMGVVGSAVKAPHLDSLIEAMDAATTIEEQQRAVKEADAYIIKNQYMVWFLKVPKFTAWHPWVIGYNGENTLGFEQRYAQMFARFWIDSEKKAAMGY